MIYEVEGEAVIQFSSEIEADSPDEAIQKSIEEMQQDGYAEVRVTRVDCRPQDFDGD